MLSLVNDILDLSKVEANQLVLEEIEFNLIGMAEESVEIYELKAAEKKVELTCWMDPAINSIRIGDPSRLRQIILNLISNALKFTEKGEIVINIEIESQQHDDQYSLRITVKDTGIGIPAEKLEAIFASFTQVDSSTTRKYGGTGLGLTISRSLVQMMGGKIWVESEINKGSSFIFTVNLPISDNVKKSDNSYSEKLSGKNITVIDDNLTVLNVLEPYLRSRGATIRSFSNGHEFLSYIGETPDNSLIDLIVLDSKMPEIDGFQLAENLQKIGLTTPILFMLNPATLNENTEKPKKLGAETYITKPVRMSDLLQQMERLLIGGSVDNLMSQSTESTDIGRPLDILLVDDNPDNRLLVSAYLKKLPYTLEEAENGEEAVSKFMSSNYDVVLMDVQMPVMDGREATRQIREWENQNGKVRTPIIALTAHAIKEEIDLCIEAGWDLHLSKPVKNRH